MAANTPDDDQQRNRPAWFSGDPPPVTADPGNGHSPASGVAFPLPPAAQRAPAAPQAVNLQAANSQAAISQAADLGAASSRAAGFQRPDQPAPPPEALRQPRPEDLLLPAAPPVSDAPAQWGWRGRIRRATGGLIKPQPTADELAHRAALAGVQRGFARPMTVVVIQPKGGAGKTPTTVGLASALGVHRGGYVVGWDDNETRGTLAVRVINPDGQRTTVWDLLGQLAVFERPDARVGDLAYFVRSQGEAQFDALVSDDSPGNMAQIGEQEYQRIHRVLQRFYRMIVVDTGNNVRSPNWQAAVNSADLVVVVSTYQRDVGYSASWVLDHLMQTGRQHLAAGAVTVLTAADPNPDERVRSELKQHFASRTRAVVEIPFDAHLAIGGPIRWSQLAPRTRQAWVHAGAAVVQALAERTEGR